MYKVAHYSLYTCFLIKLSDCVVVIQCDYLPLPLLTSASPALLRPAPLRDYHTASS